MKVEQEHQWKKSQQTQPEPGETSGEGSSTSILKVKSQKGKTVEIVQVEEDKPVEKKLDKSRRKDKSEKRDEPTEQEETEDKSDTPPIEFKDQMYELMQEAEDDERVPGNDFRMRRRICFTVNTKGESQILRNERILPVTGKRDRARNGAEVS